MARLTEEQIANIERQADLAERKAAAEAKLAGVQPVWKVKEQQTQKDYYARMNQAHDQAMQMRRARMAASPGSYNPWDKEGVDKYFKDKAEEEQRIADNEYRNKELETKESVASWEAHGKEKFGSEAAKYKAEADKYASDNQLKGVQAQAEAQRELEKGKLEAEKWIAGRKTESAEAISRNEHGYFDADGTYHPGSDVHAAKEQGNWRSSLETQRQQGRERLQKIKGEQEEEEIEKKGLWSLLKESINADQTFKIKDIPEILKKAGKSDEEINELMRKDGIVLDEGEKAKEEQKLSSTARTPAMIINRFA